MSKKMKLMVYSILLGLLLVSVNVCSAHVSYKWNQIVIEDEPNINLTGIYNDLYPDYGNSLIYHDNNGIWYANKTILCDRSNLSIKYPEVKELRVDNTDGYRYSIHGTSIGSDAKGIIFDGITYVGWNSTSNSPEFDKDEKKSLEIDKGHVSNSTFKNISLLYLYNVKDTEIQNITITNNSEGIQIQDSINLIVHDINMYNTTYALITDNLKNCTFYNISGFNVEKGQILFKRTHYSLFYNISAQHFGSYLSPNTGSGGIYWFESSNNTGHDFYMNDTGWSSFAPGDNYGNWSNLTIHNSGHNGIDLHNIKNTVINNASIYDSVSNNILLTAGWPYSPATENITLKNIYSKNSGIVAQSNVSDIFIENLEQEGSRDGMGISVKNFTVINSTLKGENDAEISIYKYENEMPTNVSIIDAKFSKLDVIDGKNTKIINSVYKGSIYKNHTLYYYPDIITVDQKGGSLNCNVEFINEVNNLYSSVNALGESKAIFSSKNGSMLPLNLNRQNKSAIAYEYISSDGTHYIFRHTAIITALDHRTISLSGITPDSSWYRKDPNVPTYTIIAIVPDDSKGPHITGFAPSTDNPFNLGEKKNFRVWADGNLTDTQWFVDGVQVAKDTLNFIWTVNEGSHTIEFSGVGANGNVNNTWNLGEGSGNPGEGGGNPVVGFFPESTALTKNTGESVTFNVDSSQLLNTKWFINGKLVQNYAKTLTWNWGTPGTYNVTFSGSASGKPVLNSWSVYVIDSSNYHPLWDVKEDGIVDILDVTSISRHYGEVYTNKPYPRWDVNQDGVINIQDLYLAGDHFGETAN